MNQASITEAVFPIRVVAERTGINPVTLRAWERRHGLIRPQRTAKGHRLYSDADIHTIARIIELLEQGVAISRVKEMLGKPVAAAPVHRPARQEFEQTARSASADTWDGYCRRMAAAVGDFDERTLEAAYNEALSLYPVDLVTQQLLLRLLRELEARWATLPHADAERRFVHSYLRNKLGARLHHWSLQHNGGARLLLAGVPGEHCETSLLLLALALRSAGYQVILLGADCQLDALPHAVERAQAVGLVLHADRLLPAHLLARLRGFRRQLGCPVFMAGHCTGTQREALVAARLTVLDSDAAGAAAQTIQLTLAQPGDPAG